MGAEVSPGREVGGCLDALDDDGAAGSFGELDQAVGEGASNRVVNEVLGKAQVQFDEVGLQQDDMTQASAERPVEGVDVT